jgi:hypothetical protein
MSQPFDLSQFPDLPPEVVQAFSAQQKALEHAKFEASVERAARQHEQAVVAEKEAFITELKALIEKLEGQVLDYRRTKFGPKSEKLDPAQLELALEDLERVIAETQAQIEAVEERLAASETDPEQKAPRKTRKARALPQSLPRVEYVIEPDSIICPCGCGDMIKPPLSWFASKPLPGNGRGPERTAGLHPGKLSGYRFHPPEIRLPQGARGRGAGEGTGAPAGGKLADRGASGADRRL